ncbi:MAG: UDP-N-acetylmuramate:L-alanyl-gamma-D-glutamyl-meso-diaminopimelate ligase [Gammaproteobacteria bacterium]
MHIHILGICGTFMGGVARLALEAGHTVSGSDANVYPPMSTQLESLGVAIDALDDISQFSRSIDQVVVGNAMVRGYAVVEHLLNSGLAYTSGPQWLAEHVLHNQHVLAVSGTHGKTTTSSMLAWILSAAGREPGFLIGGVPANFNESARAGAGSFFVVEADEYDSAFFDKRSKFVHYRPRTLIMNNLEFDHADIFDSLADIQRQFHHVVRTVPGDGRIVCNATDAALKEVLAMGCWSELETFGLEITADWVLKGKRVDYHGAQFDHWSLPMPGAHNASNALAAVAAAAHVGVPVEQAIESLRDFKGIARRLQVRGCVNEVTVYDDFAHHPTAIKATLDAVRREVEGRVVAVLEPRSNTMKTSVNLEDLTDALALADSSWILAPSDLQWDVATVVDAVPVGKACPDVAVLLEELVPTLRAGDHVVVMSNGAFGGIHEKILAALEMFDA